VILLVVSSAGQATSPGRSASSASSKSHRGVAPGGERSMKGCLTQDESGTYFLQTQRSAKVKLESAEDLSSRIGRFVRVTGAFVDTHPPIGDGTSAANGYPKNSSAQSHSVRAFRVFKTDVLSQTCAIRRK